MGFFLSKLLPQLIYPLGLGLLLQLIAIGGHKRRCSKLRVLSGCSRPYAVRAPCGLSGRLCAASAVLRGGNVSITG